MPEIKIREVVAKWLNEQGLREPSILAQEDYNAVRALLGSDRPGFGVLWSMIMFERQQAQIQLTNCPLSTAEGRDRAARLQGQIQMVDIIREMVLTIADPEGERSAPETDEAGVTFYGR